MNNPVCRICGSNLNKIIYNRPIRKGGVGSKTIRGYQIHQCDICAFVFLNPIPKNLNDFYENDDYRVQFEKDIASIQEKYDPEQGSRISRIGIQTLRNKVVADYGASAGLFLDAIKGITKKTIAVEPSRLYQKYLRSQKHICYSYADKVKEKIDVAVSFDTIEHILDLNGFVEHIFNSLVNNGIFYLSMPNYSDLVRIVCRDSFEPFFYQVSHLNYFDKNSAKLLLKFAGFKEVRIEYLHKYTINNLLLKIPNQVIFIPGIYLIQVSIIYIGQK